MLKKRIISLLLCLVLATSLGIPALADGDEYTPVASAEDLALLRADPSGSYRLTADLDMAGVDWEPLAFRGRRTHYLQSDRHPDWRRPDGNPGR